ncbi:hypothetical protein BGZ65_003858, partial [Modicella reniformis]
MGSPASVPACAVRGHFQCEHYHEIDHLTQQEGMPQFEYITKLFLVLDEAQFLGDEFNGRTNHRDPCSHLSSKHFKTLINGGLLSYLAGQCAGSGVKDSSSPFE